MAEMPVPESFSVTSTDGLKLSAKYFETSDSSTCVIIFSHGWGAIWADMLKYAPLFSDCNCDFVMYDHRVHGESEGEYATGGLKEAQDLWLLTEWLQNNKSMPLSQIGWIGSSWGAASSIIAGADQRNVGFIIADSPFQDWNAAVFERAIRDYGSGIKFLAVGVMQVVSLRAGVDYKKASALDNVSAIEEPLLLIHSEGDQETASTQSVNISKNMKPDHTQFHHTPWGNDHVMDVVANTNEFRSIVNDFLKQEAPQFLKAETTSEPSDL